VNVLLLSFSFDLRFLLIWMVNVGRRWSILWETGLIIYQYQDNSCKGTPVRELQSIEGAHFQKEVTLERDV